jgi:toxin ParE1/3/4
MKTYQIIWTKQASLDLQVIVDWVAKDHPRTAFSLYKRIKRQCQNLARQPLRCRVVPELENIGITTYRELISSPYRIVFKLQENSLYVVAVIDGRRDFQALFDLRMFRVELE